MLTKNQMLKHVGASGQISLGKKYAGKLFQMEIQADGTILMHPVTVVASSPAVHEHQPAYQAAKGSKVSQETREWVRTHGREIEEYNAWALQREPYSQRVRRWREEGV